MLFFSDNESHHIIHSTATINSFGCFTQLATNMHLSMQHFSLLNFNYGAPYYPGNYGTPTIASSNTRATSPDEQNQNMWNTYKEFYSEHESVNDCIIGDPNILKHVSTSDDSNNEDSSNSKNDYTSDAPPRHHPKYDSPTTLMTPPLSPPSYIATEEVKHPSTCHILAAIYGLLGTKRRRSSAGPAQPKNPISALNELVPGLEYVVVSQSGAAHNPSFTMRVTVR